MFENSFSDLFTKALKVCGRSTTSIDEKVRMHRRHLRPAACRAAHSGIGDDLPGLKFMRVIRLPRRGPTQWVAEGAARQTKNEFRQFLYIALGSSSELDTLLQLSLELGFVEKDTVDILLKIRNHF